MAVSFDLTPFSTAEMVSTVVQSWMHSKEASGRFGRIESAPLAKRGSGTFKVILADDRGTFLVRNAKGFWHVRKALFDPAHGYIRHDLGVDGVSEDIEEAAWLALDA